MEKGNVWLQVSAALSATLVYLIAGCFLGWTAPTIPQLLGKDSHIPITSDQAAWVAAMISFGMLLPPIPTGFIVNTIGRKTTLVATSVPFLISWLMVVFAATPEELYASRFLAGVAFGVVCTVGPMYIGEIAEDRIRGAMGTMFQVMLNLGTLFEFCIGPYVDYGTLAIVSAVFPFIFFATFICMPESPYFLVARNRHDDAEKALLKLRGKKLPESVKEELEAIQNFVAVQEKNTWSLLDILTNRGNRRALGIVLGLMFVQNFSGIIPLLTYATTIFMRSGSSIDANISVIIMGIVQLVISVISSLLVDRAGRRPLLLVSSIGCSLALLGEGFYFYFAAQLDDSLHIDWIPITLMLVYIVSYSLGLGPLPWAVAGEVFQTNIKGLAMSITSMTTATFSLILVKLFQVMIDSTGPHLPFWIFSAISCLGAVFIGVFLPETKGKSLPEINKELNKTCKVEDINGKINQPNGLP